MAESQDYFMQADARRIADLEAQLAACQENYRLMDAGRTRAEADRDRLRADNEALARFKAYVHQRLDEAGIETHPDGPHSKEGCRVGDRLDIALALRADNEALAAALERMILWHDYIWESKPPPERREVIVVEAREALARHREGKQ